jgi:hypothetical protein
MRKSIKGKRGLIWVVSLLSLLALSSFLSGYEKKLRVVADYTHVYLQPDEDSPVIDTIERGTILSLLYGGKMKRVWYYVCFKSEKSNITKSGYVLDSEVEPLFDSLKTITIREDDENLRVQYAPRNFEELRWGLTKKQVVEREGKPAAQERTKAGEVMRYEQKVINLDCEIEYHFTANKLNRTRFSFTSDSPDKNTYLDDYRKIKEALTQKFGRPAEERMNWRDNSYKDDFGAWGEAISLGHLELNSRWLTPQTEIQASLKGKNQQVSLTVEYRSIELRELAKKSQEED